jgi:hypothetical protein
LRDGAVIGSAHDAFGSRARRMTGIKPEELCMCSRNIAFAALVTFVASTSLVSAEDRKDARQREAVEQAKVKMEDAVAVAQRVFPDGRVVDRDVETVKGRVVYAIEIEKDGMKTVLVDLQSGDVVNVGPKREKRGDDDDDDDDD